jgi:hypothetical protein
VTSAARGCFRLELMSSFDLLTQILCIWSVGIFRPSHAVHKLLKCIDLAGKLIRIKNGGSGILDR